MQITEKTNREVEQEKEIQSHNKMFAELQETITKLENEQSSEIFKLETSLEQEKINVEILENEKNKLKEELDTANQTLNFKDGELRETKKLLNSVKAAVS